MATMKVDPAEVAAAVRAARGEKPELSAAEQQAMLDGMLAGGQVALETAAESAVGRPLTAAERAAIADELLRAARAGAPTAANPTHPVRSRPLRVRRLPQLRQAVAAMPAAAQAAANQAVHAVQAARAAVAPTPHDPTAPLRREWIDDAVPILRWVGGVVLIGYSSVSTVVGVNSDLHPVTTLLTDPNVVVGGLALPLTLLIAVLVAAGLQLLQFVLPERSPAGYGLSLAFDAWYTRRQSSLWIVAVLGMALAVSPLTAEIVLWGITVGMGTKLVREMLRSPGQDRALIVGILAGALYGLMFGPVLQLPDAHGVRVASRWLVLEAIQWVIAIAIAYFGEVLLLGRRRRQAA